MSDNENTTVLSRRHLITGAGAISGLALTGGCGGDGSDGFPGKGKDGTKRVVVEVKGRSVGVFLPKPKATKGMPLILFLHPGSNNLTSIAKRIGVFAWDSKFPAVVGLPNGQSLLFPAHCHWNSGHIKGGDADDVAVLRAVMADLTKRYNIDPKRVYLMGTSNGGMMVYRAAAELSNKLAGVHAHAATIGGKMDKGMPQWVNDPKKHGARPVSVMHTHGDKDVTVRSAGGKSSKSDRVDIGVSESVAYWITHNKTKKPAPTEFKPGEVWKSNGGERGTKVWVKIFPGLGHGWDDSIIPLALEFFGLN